MTRDTDPATNTTPMTKRALVTRLIARRTGASMRELIDATGWQPHSLRGQLSTLRKTGAVIMRIERRGGEKAYCLKRQASGRG